jgi:hypothetical protein
MKYNVENIAGIIGITSGIITILTVAPFLILFFETHPGLTKVNCETVTISPNNDTMCKETMCTNSNYCNYNSCSSNQPGVCCTKSQTCINECSITFNYKIDASIYCGSTTIYVEPKDIDRYQNVTCWEGYRDIQDRCSVTLNYKLNRAMYIAGYVFLIIFSINGGIFVLTVLMLIIKCSMLGV